MELFQIWLNLPRANKLVEPHFKMFWGEDIPKYKHVDAQGKSTVAEVIVGNIARHTAPAPPPDSWAAVASNEVAVWNIAMDAGATWTLPKASKGTHRTIYFYKGQSLKIDGIALPFYHSAELKPDANVVLTSGDESSHVLILQGRPINEPVVQHGPFVMNSRQEIQEAFQDYQNTQFGGWPWPELDHVHDRNSGRFALHADGRKEVKG